MRVLLFANGEPPSRDLAHELAALADLVIAADGGGDVALGLGIEPHLVTGDLDSLSEAARSSLGPERLVRDANVDHTDLEKAIHLALARGATEVDIIAAGGGRADHALANLPVLFLFHGRTRLRIVDDLFEVSAVRDTAVIDAPPGTVVSLLALCGCEVTTTGLRWDLHEHALQFSPYGIHNEVASRPASVAVSSGELLLFKGRFIEPHQSPPSA